MTLFTRRGRPPPPRLVLMLMVMPFALIDTFAVFALVLGLVDLLIHLLIAWTKSAPAKIDSSEGTQIAFSVWGSGLGSPTPSKNFDPSLPLPPESNQS